MTPDADRAAVAREVQVLTACCYDCGLLYGSAGWADCVVAPDVWEQLSPTGDEGGLLCFTCMTRRAVRLGLTDVPLRITSGPWADGAAGVSAAMCDVPGVTQPVSSSTGASSAAAPATVPPPIPLGAVVEVEGYAATPFGRYDKEWMDDDETCWPDADAMGRAPLVTALYHARRERDWWQNATLEQAAKTETAERERDAARRELAAREPCATSPSPAPASAPRRWWLVVDCDGTPREAYEWDERHVADKDAAAYNRSDDTFAPFSVVPVIEARVTRETVDRAATKIREEIDGLRWGEAIDCVRAALSVLGLTVEE